MPWLAAINLSAALVAGSLSDVERERRDRAMKAVKNTEKELDRVNCRNCGAPKSGYRCSYCLTVHAALGAPVAPTP